MLTHHKFCPAFFMLETLAVPESEMSVGKKYSASELANLSPVRKVNFSAGKNCESAANTKIAKSFFIGVSLYFNRRCFLLIFFEIRFPLNSMILKFCCLSHGIFLFIVFFIKRIHNVADYIQVALGETSKFVFYFLNLRIFGGIVG